jgi:hypothetical protein
MSLYPVVPYHTTPRNLAYLRDVVAGWGANIAPFPVVLMAASPTIQGGVAGQPYGFQLKRVPGGLDVTPVPLSQGLTLDGLRLALKSLAAAPGALPLVSGAGRVLNLSVFDGATRYSTVKGYPFVAAFITAAP